MFKNENIFRFIEPYYVHKIFLSTSSGLTRWKRFNTAVYQNIYGEAEAANDRSIDEDWYQRSVEENLKNEDMFIYSVPFEISGEFQIFFVVLYIITYFQSYNNFFS